LQSAACFTYGSLMWPDIMARVCGCEASELMHCRAWLSGHSRHPVLGQDYPGLVVRRGAAPLQGVLYRGLSPHHLQRLDAFEGQEYERVAVEVALEAPGASRAFATVADGGATGAVEQAWVYRYRADLAHRLGPGDWSEQGFETHAEPMAGWPRAITSASSPA